MSRNLEIERQLGLVYKAIKSLSSFEAQNSAISRSRIIRFEEKVCMSSRALYSKFVDVSLWSRDVEPKAYKCHHDGCGELIFLGSDRQKENFAHCATMPALTVDMAPAWQSMRLM